MTSSSPGLLGQDVWEWKQERNERSSIEWSIFQGRWPFGMFWAYKITLNFNRWLTQYSRNLLYQQFSWPSGHFITLKHYPPLLLKFTWLGLSSTLGKGGPWTTSSFNVAEESKQQGPPIVRIHPDHGREAKIGTSTPQSFLKFVLWLQIFVQVNYFISNLNRFGCVIGFWTRKLFLFLSFCCLSHI